MTPPDFRRALDARAEASGQTISESIADDLVIYFQALSSWNRRINLTGFDLDSPSEAAIDRLFLEPLRAALAIDRPVHTLLDIGSGGGSPGIPITLALKPNRAILIEARHRKAVFLRETGRILGLASRLEVYNSRFETLVTDERFNATVDLVTVRAVRMGLPELATLSGFLSATGEILLFADPSSLENIVPDGLRVSRVVIIGSDHRQRATLLSRC